MHLKPVQPPNATHQDLAMTPAQLMELVGKQEREIVNLRRQVAWFQRQIFGQKSERRLPEPDGMQGTLGESFTAMPEAPPNRKSPVAAHEREHKAKRPTDGADESTLFFDDTKVLVEVIAGMLVDKFMYHQPLYRQHQRLHDSHINVSRPWLTQLTQKTVMLIEPVFDAQLDSVRASRVKAMDETPIKAGLAGPGKMKSAHIWPVYGERDEICFLYYPSRSARHVQDALGLSPPEGAVLQSDGYAAYAQYAKKTGLMHAQCWAHARRKMFEAKEIEPAHAEQALEMIGALYAVEAQIRAEGLTGHAKRERRGEQAKPVAARLFAWIDRQFDAQGFLPSSPFLTALAYAYIRERRAGLSVYLDDPEVAIDTNHLERALRVIPMGRRNWLFAWTELGAKHVGIVQSLLVTCRLHDINPYDYLVDVLQRVGQHPASRVHELTPRLRKQLFAHNPLHSDLHQPAA